MCTTDTHAPHGIEAAAERVGTGTQHVSQCTKHTGLITLHDGAARVRTLRALARHRCHPLAGEERIA